MRWLVLSQVGRISLAGGTIGAMLALAIGRVGQCCTRQGYHLSIIGEAALLILSVVVLAAVVPARREIRVQPVEVLKAE